MPRNALCWCNSGLKWKQCHRAREFEKPQNYFEVQPKFRKNFESGACSHPEAPDGCSGKSINSHTVQKGSSLAAISEQGHVYSSRQAVNRIHQNKGVLVPQRTGVNSASTFPGFCSKHDTSLFLPIESGDLPITRQTAFLLSYRAMAYERHAKRSSLESLELGRTADAGRPFEEQVEIQSFLNAFIEGSELGLQDLTRWKNKLDAIYKSGDTADIGMLAVTFEDTLPFVAAFGIMPEWDFAGLKLQSLLAEEPDQASVTITVAAGVTVALFTWFGGENSAGAKLAKSFSQLPDDQKGTGLIRFALASSENVHMRPSWWEGIGEKEREDALRLVHLGTANERGLRRFDDFLPTEGHLRLKSAVKTTEFL